MRPLLRYVQKWWKIRREELHTYKIISLLDRNEIHRDVKYCRGRTLPEEEEECMSMNHSEYIYTQRLPVQIMLWRLVSGMWSCKHFCDVQFLISTSSYLCRRFGWMSEMSTLLFFSSSTLYSNQEFVWLSCVSIQLCLPLALHTGCHGWHSADDRRGASRPDAGIPLDNLLLFQLPLPDGKDSHAARQLSAFLWLILYKDWGEAHTSVTHSYIWEIAILSVLFKIELAQNCHNPTIPTVYDVFAASWHLHQNMVLLLWHQSTDEWYAYIWVISPGIWRGLEGND